jgi:hypothetical protein
LFHVLSQGMVEPRIRQASPVLTNGSSPPLPEDLPKLMRKRRKSNLELITVHPDSGDVPRFGIMDEEQMPLQSQRLQNLNIEGLNQATQHNQMHLMRETPKLNVLMKDRHERPSLFEQLNERNKKVQMEEMESPNAILRAFSMSMKMGEDSDPKLGSFSMSLAMEEREMDLTYNMVQRQFSMSMGMPPRTRSGGSDEGVAWTEDNEFFSRSGSAFMMVSMSMGSRTIADHESQESGRIPLRPRSINFFQMQDMSMAPTMPSVPSAPSTPTTASPISLPSVTTTSPDGSSGSLPPDPSPSLAPDGVSGGGPTDAPAATAGPVRTQAPVPTDSPVPTQAPVPTTSPAPSEPIMPDRTLAPTEEGTDELSAAASTQGFSGISILLGSAVFWLGGLL